MARSRRPDRIRVDWAFAGVLGFLLTPAWASAGTVTTWELINKTGQKVSDAELIFSGTGNSITKAMTVKNDPNAGPATITGATNTIKVTWGAANYFPNKSIYQFQFTVDVPFPQDVKGLGGTWTRTALGLPSIPVTLGAGGNTELILLSVPEPSSLMLGSIAVLSGLIVYIRRFILARSGISRD
jgi:hypothetical protein